MGTFVYYVCAVIVVITSYNVCNRMELYVVAGLIDGLFALIAVSFVLFIYYQCRNHHNLNDNLLFFYEIKFCAFIWAICLANYFIVQVLYVLEFNMIAGVMYVFAAIFAFVAPSLMSTLWIPRKVAANQMWRKHSHSKILPDPLPLHDRASSVALDLEQNSLSQSLQETLKDEVAFEAFVHWMYREFSSEAALCFVEMSQFKECLVKFARKDTLGTTREKYKYVGVLYDEIPKSSIVFEKRSNVDGIERMKHIAHRLHDKYIKEYSELEVNISYPLRCEYLQMDKEKWNMDLDKFIKIFDPVMKEMFNTFMTQSFMRYQHTLLEL